MAVDTGDTMADWYIEWMLWLAFAPIVGGVLFLLGWLRWWVGVVPLLLLAAIFAKQVSFRPLDDAGLFLVLNLALALLAIAAGVGFDYVLRRKRGASSGRPVQRVPVTRPLYPYALDVVPAFMAAVLGAGLFAYVFYAAMAPSKDTSPSLADLVLGLLRAMAAVIWLGAPTLLEGAVLFAVAFLILRDLGALNLLWLAITGAVIGLAMALRLNFPSVLAAVAIGLVGGSTAYLELRRRVARYAAPPPGAPAPGAPLPPWALAVQRATRAAVAALRKGATIVAAGERAASAAMGGGSRARSIAALSLALVVAVTVFQVFGHSVLVASGYGADSVVLPAVMGALVAALLAYWATDALVTQLEDQSRQRIALVSLVLATVSIASLPSTLFA